MSNAILDSLCQTAKALAETFGKNCETIVHDYKDAECKIVVIYNGHVSGRSVHSKESIYGITVSSVDCKELIPATNVSNAFLTTIDGRQLKSTSINFIGKDYHYVLGINYDCSSLSAMNIILSDMLQTGDSFSAMPVADKKISDAINQCQSIIGKSFESMNKADRKRIVSMLNERNVFFIQKAVPYVSERLGVSRYTIYNYLNELKLEAEQRNGRSGV